MKVGDLVRPTIRDTSLLAINWIGVVIDPSGFGGVVVYWNDKYPNEVENRDYLEVISESR